MQMAPRNGRRGRPSGEVRAGHHGGVERALVAAVVVLVAAAVAVVVERRRRPDAPTQGRTSGPWPVPVQLDRADFGGGDRPWLVAVFTSATCDSCQDAIGKAAALASGEVAVEEIEVGGRRDLHDRYGIEAVPTTLLADAEGVVRASIVGPVTAADLWSAVADVRAAASAGDEAPPPD